ncbi:hypothetical protein BDY24DRAFT_381422 [Mrakia frigida]|uniref:uncharacterized protein n=1 Tax=Mrakia frigida TaxID=29902 RepID=UPI003FCC038E
MGFLGRSLSGISSRTSLGLVSSRIRLLPRLSQRSTSDLASTPSTSELIPPFPPSPSPSSSLPPSSTSRNPTPVSPSLTSRTPLASEFAFPLVFQHPNHPQPFAMLHDVKLAKETRLSLTEGVDYATSVARRQIASRLSSPDRRIVARARLTSQIAKIVRQQKHELAIFGAISTKTHVDKSYLSLGIVVEDESRSSEDILAGLVEPLRSAGLTVTTPRPSLLRCETVISPTESEFTVAFVSVQSPQDLVLNSLVASYTALSPDVLAPLVRAVTAIGPGKEFVHNDTHRNQMLSFLCIAYLQSLSSPLLPNLQSKDLIAKLNPPPSEAALPVRRTHVGLETVDTTFVSIGLTPPLREKLGWKQGTEADREFARDWVGKGKGGPPLKDLLRGFYMVYGGKAREMFDWDTGVVSVSSGGLKMRHDVKGNRSWSRGTLVVQHPFVETINLTSEVKEGPDQIDAMFHRCLQDELLRDDAPPLEMYMYKYRNHSNPSRPSPPQVKTPTRPARGSPVPLSSKSTLPSSLPTRGSAQQGYRVVFENLPPSFDLSTFDRFLQSAKLQFDGPAALASPEDGSVVGEIVVKDLEGVEAATKLNQMRVYGQLISVKLSPSTPSS